MYKKLILTIVSISLILIMLMMMQLFSKLNTKKSPYLLD